MAFPDYNFYKDHSIGVAIPESEWPKYCQASNDEIASWERKLTVRGSEEQRGKAVCAIADAMYASSVVSNAMIPVDENGNVGTTRVSIGSVSTSTDSVNPTAAGMDLTESGQQKLYYQLISKYMDVWRGRPEFCKGRRVIW